MSGTHLSAIQFDVSAQCNGCQGCSHNTSENRRDNEANENPGYSKNASNKSSRRSVAIAERNRDKKQITGTEVTKPKYDVADVKTGN